MDETNRTRFIIVALRAQRWCSDVAAGEPVGDRCDDRQDIAAATRRAHE